jgi:hypothetical protein
MMLHYYEHHFQVREFADDFEPRAHCTLDNLSWSSGLRLLLVNISAHGREIPSTSIW